MRARSWPSLPAAASPSPAATRCCGLRRANRRSRCLPDALDRDPWPLNCPNGTLDLRTGELRPHRREDYLTKLCRWNTTRTPSARLGWRPWTVASGATVSLSTSYSASPATVCTGDVIEQVMCIWHGVGANGKSTILNGCLEMLGGDYAMKASGDLLMVKRGEEHPTGLTDLAGRRLVAAIETAEGHRLAETLVKELVGGDPIRATADEGKLLAVQPDAQGHLGVQPSAGGAGARTWLSGVG